MLSKERKFRIMNIFNEKSFVTIAELMEDLNVSKSTVTRDLIELEKDGIIQRERGGAIKVEMSETLNNFKDIPVREKEMIHSDSKRLICENAANNIMDGDCVYIDSGTTPSYLIQFLGNKNIKVVTPSTYVIRKLPLDFRGEVYLVGGQFNVGYDMSIGYHTLDMIKKFHFNKAFFSASGVNLENGEVVSVDFEIGSVKEEVLKRSDHKYLLIDDSKLSIRAIATWADIFDFEKVYMNEPENKKIKLPKHFYICK